MEKAEAVTAPTEEIVATIGGIVAETKEEVKEAPSRLRKKLREFEAIRECASIQFYQAPKHKGMPYFSLCAGGPTALCSDIGPLKIMEHRCLFGRAAREDG